MLYMIQIYNLFHVPWLGGIIELNIFNAPLKRDHEDRKVLSFEISYICGSETVLILKINILMK